MVDLSYDTTALLLLSLVVLVSVEQIASIFSDDPKVIEAFVQVRWPLSAMIFVMNFAVFLVDPSAPPTTLFSRFLYVFPSFSRERSLFVASRESHVRDMRRQERIPVAMGRTKTVFYAGVVGSWIGQVPGVMLVLRFWRNDLIGLYWGVTFGYALLCLVLMAIIYDIKWEDVVNEARARANSK